MCIGWTGPVLAPQWCDDRRGPHASNERSNFITFFLKQFIFWSFFPNSLPQGGHISLGTAQYSPSDATSLFKKFWWIVRLPACHNIIKIISIEQIQILKQNDFPGRSRKAKRALTDGGEARLTTILTHYKVTCWSAASSALQSPILFSFIMSDLI